MKTRIISLCFVVMLCVGLLTSCSGGYTSDQSCEHCGMGPTKNFPTVNGTDCYICEWCSTHCAFCNESASEEYTNGFDVQMFVCKECYADIISW